MSAEFPWCSGDGFHLRMVGWVRGGGVRRILVAVGVVWGASHGPMAAPFKHSAGVEGWRGERVTQCVFVVCSCKHGSGFNRVHPHGMLLSTTTTIVPPLPFPPPSPQRTQHHHPLMNLSAKWTLLSCAPPFRVHEPTCARPSMETLKHISACLEGETWLPSEI